VIRADFAATGRVWLRNAVPPAGLDALAAELPDGAARIGPDHPLLQDNGAWLPALQAIWPGWRPVRAVGFDKSSAQNWSVPWHQDRVIAVAERRDVPGFSGWSDRGGYWHCTPPLEVLEDMLFVRVHLDPSEAQSGGMEIARGSHRMGEIRAGRVDAALASCPIEGTAAAPGDILVLHMLTLHRSRRLKPRPRGG